MFSIDAFNAVPIGLYLLLFLGSMWMLPRQDLRKGKSNYALVLLGALLAYCATNTGLIWLGWTISAWPLIAGQPVHRLSRATVIAGCAALGGGLALLATGQHTEWAFALVVLAVIQRKGLFPLQSWLADSFQHGDLLLNGLIFNTHLGIVVIARVALPLMPDLSRSSLTVLSDIGLATAVISAVMAVAERSPRRILAFVATSQSATLLAGLEGRNVEAITGSLLHWMVVPLATTALLAVVRMLEVRNGGSLPTHAHLGLGGRFPRLATFFIVAGVALVGLPGTMGFISEDLLMHGALEAHPWIGLAIPLSTALNAVTILRLSSRLFFGSRQEPLPTVPDAMLRERLPLAAIVLTLVLFGIFPQLPISLRSGAAARLVRAESAGSGTVPE